MRVVQLLQKRKRFAFVLRGQHRGKLRGQGGVVRGLLERGSQDGLGIGVFSLRNEDVGKSGVGFRILGVFGEDAAVGSFGRFRLV
jgi:hypothetical protein